jgi:hypothetical protein
MRCWSDAIASRVLSTVLVSWFLPGDCSIAAQPNKVRISYSSRSNSNMPFIALNKGFFDVELIQVNPRLGATAVLQQNPLLVKRAVRALMKSHRYVFENKKEVVPQMIRYLEQTPEVAERSYDLLVTSLSRNGEITDQEWDILTEKKKAVDDVRDFSMLREAQKELRIK